MCLEWMLNICSICSPNLELLIFPPHITHLHWACGFPQSSGSGRSICTGSPRAWCQLPHPSCYTGLLGFDGSHVPPSLTSSCPEKSHFLLEASGTICTYTMALGPSLGACSILRGMESSVLQVLLASQPDSPVPGSVGRVWQAKETIVLFVWCMSHPKLWVPLTPEPSTVTSSSYILSKYLLKGVGPRQCTVSS